MMALANTGPSGRFKPRRHQRFAIDQELQIRADRAPRCDPEVGRMIDVSEGGFAFVGSRYLTPGTKLTVEFLDCRVTGEVRHCRMREYAGHTQFVTGVKVREVQDGVATWKSMMRAPR